MDEATKYKYHGKLLRSRALGELMFSELAYAPEARISPHEHGCSYVALVLSGSFDDRVGKRTEWCQPGSVMIRPSGVVHSSRYGIRSARIFSFQVPNGDLEDLARRGVRLDCQVEWGSRLGRIVAEMYSEFVLEDGFSDLGLQGLFYQALAEIGRENECTDKPRWVGRVEDRLRDTSSEPSIRQLAELAGLPMTVFAKHFKAHFGATVSQHLRYLRIEQAKDLLKTGRSIGEIAEELGFSDHSHLTRTFTRVTGLTPTQHRALFR